MVEHLCPHCKASASKCISDRPVMLNAENYGGGSYHIPCGNCGKMVVVYAKRTVVLSGISKSDRDPSDASW